MEALYLLFSILTTFITSSFLSISLAFKLLTHRLLSSSNADADAVLFYEGRVHHTRRRPAHHSFEYPVRYALLDLDRSPQSSYLSAQRAREVAGTDGPVLLLTIPENVGYEQNPLSVYYCYDAAKGDEDEGFWPSGRLKQCIAEVTNTPWGERVSFVFNPGSDVVAKPLHVSPFMDMQGNWHLSTDAPGEELSLLISVQHPTLGNYFTATLHAKRVDMSSNSLNLATFFWLMPHKVALWIYLQALKLWWKNVSFLSHPKFMNPRYRDDALLHNKELRCTYNAERSKKISSYASDVDNKEWWCVWREAPWPWS